MRRVLLAIGVLSLGFSVLAQWNLLLLHVNDVHSRLDEMAKVATLVEEIRAQVPDVLFLHAGDQFLGTLYFTIHKGLADAEILNLLGVSAMVPGNHEFDEGPRGLAYFADIVQFPILCANCNVSDEPLLTDHILPYAVFTVAGRKVGVIGVTTPDAAWSSSPGPNVTFTDPGEAVRTTISSLSAQGVDVIIVLSHLGWDKDLVLAQSVSGIDVIVGGHSHTLPKDYPTVVERKLLNLNTATQAELEKLPGIGAVLAKRIIEWRETKGPFKRVEDLLQVSGIGPARLAAVRDLVTVSDEPVRTLVVQAGENGQYLGRLFLTFDPAGNVVSWEGELVPTKDFAVHPRVEEKLVVFREPIAAMKAKVVGETKVALEGERALVRTQETNLGNLIADALLWKGRIAGAQIAIQNGGGIRASLPAGPVTFGDCMQVLPFGNYLVVLELTGEQIWQALENGVSQVEKTAGRFPHVAGLRFVWDPTQPPGARIVTVEVLLDGAWKPLDRNATYRLATNNFLAQGGDGYEMFKLAKNVWNLGFVDYEILAEYIAAHSPVAPQLEGRIIRK
ncbi:MAG: 5'-nucleotidase C-terminal domain-containing protein [Candidatus Bipolaricaulota bacterium]|nr:5'-nucleotidase C-terminal domain-containing protein [Candidatus Bipolaricaulota bacterium]MDW8126999.1 5'-nucleotidase C-terminal domain-containing protein [Candidatus Bipolaricaulota bacterium]